MKYVKYLAILTFCFFGNQCELTAQSLTDQPAKLTSPTTIDKQNAAPNKSIKEPQKGQKVSEAEKNAMIQKFYQSRVDFLRSELNKEVRSVEEARIKVKGYSQKFANQLGDQIITQEQYDRKMSLLAKLREQIKSYDTKVMEAQQYLTPVK